MTQTEPDPTPTDQGVAGTVLKYVGDFSCCPSTGTKVPVSVSVSAANGPVKFVWPEGASLALAEDVAVVASAPTDENGNYTIPLHTGDYTIFAEHNGAILLGGSLIPQGETYVSRPTEVLAGEFSEVHLMDTSDATF